MKKKKVEPLPAVELPDVGELPEEWTLTTLSEIGKWRTGGTPSRKINSYFYGDIAWVKSGDLNDGIITATDEKITESGLQNCAAKLLPIGTVSVALYGATIGKIGILGIEAATNQACANCIVDPKKISKEFLFYYILSQRQNLINAGQGGAQPNLTNQIIHDWPIPLPQLSEQLQIVARIEALLTQVNAARDRLSRVPLIIKKFRQAVLAAACSGRLTEGWREENPTSTSSEERDEIDELPDCYNGLQVQLPENWQFHSIREITDSIKYGYTASAREEPIGPKMLRITDIQEGHVNWESVPFCYISDQNSEKYHLTEGDIVFARTGATTGKSYRIKSCPFSIFASYLIRVRTKKEVDSNYLYLFFQSGFYWKQISDNTSGTAQPNCNASKLASLIIPFPPLAEQHEIVRRVEALFERVDQIEHQVLVATKRTDALTQAVLRKAFRGEMTTYDIKTN